jgi:2,4-dienoyl-CoA reductase-like NADH-dependent reductase (Old Yellow Enzyme family)
VLLRLSQWKQQDYDARLAQSPEEMAEWLIPLVEAGADILHCSQRRFWEAEFPEVDGKAGLNFAGWAKKITGAATLSVGSVGVAGDFLAPFPSPGSKAPKPGTLGGLALRMERGEFDLIAVGRALLGDPSWAAKLQDGEAGAIKGYTPAALGGLS